LSDREAWHAQSGLSRTEAKRRYITTLIETMHKYASASPESRELVSELEFVWDQVKSNVPSSNSSSPMQPLAIPLDLSRHGDPPGYGIYAQETREGRRGLTIRDPQGMHVMSPVSKEQLELEAAGEAEDDDEFVDAPDSQVDEALQTRNIGAVLSSPSRGRGFDQGSLPGEERRRKRRSYGQPAPPPSADERWKKNISASIIKLTAELAAVREQLESRRLFTHTIHFRILRFITKTIWGIVKHIAIDVFILGIVLLWLRSKKDKRLEGAMRVLLGDAVAQVQKLGDVQLGKIQLPKLGAGVKRGHS
jgi:hypothetical protein